ncbi:MAG: hypothetical protein NZ522_03140 [Chitinophagales bacterium]|nr:hypothetical protein [Chitinophagales bacterium]
MPRCKKIDFSKPVTLPFIIILIFFIGCKKGLNLFREQKEKPLARVYDEYLYPSDVEVVIRNLSPQDSARAVKSLVDKWLQRQLLLKKAKENIPEDDPGIMRRLEKYREDLLLYEYEKAYISEKLDTTIKQEEIDNFYQNNIHLFVLQNDVYAVQFIKLKSDAPELSRLKKMLQNIKSLEDEKQIEGYSKANALTFTYPQPLWYSGENLKAVFGFGDDEIASLRVSEKFREFVKDDGIILFLRVVQIRRKGEPAPLELAKNELAKMIIEQRRLKLVENLYKKVYKEAIASQNAEIFIQ